MLKKLQKVRDVLEEVAHAYSEISALGVALKEEGDEEEDWFVFASNRAAEIILDINNMIYTDEGYIGYLDVHNKIMHMCASMIGPQTQFVKDWLFKLIVADNEAIQGLIFI